MEFKLKLKEKLKKTGRRSKLSYLVALLAALYFLMTVVKGVYLWTDGSEFHLAQNIHAGMKLLIETTWVFGISELWKSIAAVPFEGKDILGFYKVIIPPAIVVFICALFIYDHRSLKSKYYELKAEIEKEIALRDMRREAGIDTVAESATVDVVISNATNTDPAWHDTWWGRVSIGVAIALIVAVFGIK